MHVMPLFSQIERRLWYPPVPRKRLAQEPPPGSVVEFSHHFFFTTVLGFSWFWGM